MTPEYLPSSEENEEESQVRPVFDFSQMEPDEVLGLITVLIAAADEQQEKRRAGYDEPNPYDRLLDRVGRSLESVASTSNNALDVYTILMGDLSHADCINLACGMASRLLLRYMADPVARLRIITPLVATLHKNNISNGSLAHDAAWLTLAELTGADWLDESTKQYLDSQIPE